MQSKIIFLVLFMLSFTVMHDTLICMIDDNKGLPVSEYLKNTKQINDVSEVQEMHDIFHFIALISEKHMFLEPLKEGNTFSSYLFQYALPSLKNSSKPPIA